MTNKPNQHLDLPETGAATPTSSSLKIETGTATPTSSSTKTPPKTPPKTTENPLLAAISEVTIPVLAQTFKLTPAAISSWVANKHVPWGHLARLSDLTTIPLPELLDANSQSPKQEFRGASIEEAAIAGQTPTHYLYRIARTVFESFGETLRNLRSFPAYIRYALAEDAQHTLQGGTSYAAPLLALYRKTPQTKPRRYVATLKDGFVDLLPGAIASQFTIDEIAEAKETPATVITQRFTDLLLPIGLTWHAIEQMSDYHRDAFYQLLLMKPPE